MTTLPDVLAARLRARRDRDDHGPCDALDPCTDCRDAAALVRVARVPEQRRRVVGTGRMGA